MSREEWLKKRKRGIGSSEAACLYGVGYMTELELYNEKISDDIKEKPSNFAMERGNEYEPIARKIFTSLFNIDNFTEESFEPLFVRHKDAPFMIASLDGANKDLSIIIEIKYQGQKAYDAVIDQSLPIKDGRVPLKYWIQVQHQLLVSGADVCHFVSYNPKYKNEVRCVSVLPDVGFHKEHVKKCIDFWAKVEAKLPPKPSEDDYIELSGAKALAKKYIDISNKISKYEEELKAIKAQILDKVTHPKMRCGALNIRQEERQGAIQYKDIPAIKAMSQEELSAYRGKPSVYYKLDIKA